jgi:hypothetical protein
LQAADGHGWFAKAAAESNLRRGGQPVVALQTLRLDEGLLGGWRVTMDLRWPSSVMDDEF